MGCPPGHFHEYIFTGTLLPTDWLAYNRLAYNDSTDLYIKTGYYFEFINKKEQGLAAVIKVNPNYNLASDSVVKAVNSARFGPLKQIKSLPYTVRVYDTVNTLMYQLPFNKQAESLGLKNIENDTITILLTNGEQLHFVRRPFE